MKMIEILKPDFSFEDQRGILTQITHESFAQTNAVYTKAGQIRGDYHYHRLSKEVFFVITGKIKVSLKCENEYEDHIFSSGDMFLISQNVRHRFDFLEDTYLVAFYTDRIELENGEKDIISD